MTHVDDIRGTIVDQVTVPAHLAATATEYIASWAAPADIKLVSVHFRPSAAITGADTNSTNYNLDDGGTDGDGTTELGNVDFASGTDATAGEEVELYAPTDPVALSAGNMLKLEAEKVGSGLLIPSGIMVVRYQNN